MWAGKTVIDCNLEITHISHSASLVLNGNPQDVIKHEFHK